MKTLKETINEGFVSAKRADVVKNIETIFNNIKEPKDAMEFMYDTFVAFGKAIQDKAKYSSSENPNLDTWKKIDKEMSKNIDSYIEDIEQIEHSL